MLQRIFGHWITALVLRS